jgi:hypothetical protein
LRSKVREGAIAQRLTEDCKGGVEGGGGGGGKLVLRSWLLMKRVK